MNFSRFLSTGFVAVLLTSGIAAASESGSSQDSLQPPDGMALIPAGPFQMGNNNDFYDSDYDEKPRHVVDLPPYFIDIYPVTNEDFKVFVDATGHQFPKYWSEAGNIPDGKEKHPVVGVTYIDVSAYATWKGGRLPTEQEWEKAARGTEGLRWPWGNTFDTAKANVGQRTTTPVGAYPDGRNAYGLYDMAGNVWEWTSTWYAPYPGSAPNRANMRFRNDTFLSVRGGSYGSDNGSARGADRGIKKPMDPGPSLGFRVVKDVPGYEGYREALQTIDLAKQISRTAALDVSEYTEHAASRELMMKAAALLSESKEAFSGNDFEASFILAQDSISKANMAQQIALDFKRDFLAAKEDTTAEVLGRLEMLLERMPSDGNPGQQAMIRQAINHLKLGRLFEAEGGWGYAQMHGYIGMGMLEGRSR